MLEINKIYNMNCLEGIKKIDDNSVDAIITDPPYFLGMTHNGQKGAFNDLNICEPFYRELFKEYKRALKKDGAVYFFTDWRGYAFYYPLFSEIIGASNLLVWDKGVGPGNFYSFAHEFVIFKTFKNMNGRNAGSNVIKNIKGFSGGAKRTNGEKIHPTQKPIEIIEKFINDCSNIGDLVLDTFMGGGTSAIACINTKRNFVGFEIDKKYFDIANERIMKAKNKEQ